MLKSAMLGSAIAALGAGFFATRATHTQPAPNGDHHGAPVLVELFQSQGCSSCPPANANLNAIAANPRVVALSFGVTYWDQLGWKDTFAKPQFTDRQWDYAHFNHRSNVATPQVWINGRRIIVGSNGYELDAEIARARSTGPALSLRNGTATVGAGLAPAGGADVWLARYDPRIVNVPIRAGENNGRTLPHRNVVRALMTIGHWTGKASAFAVPAAPAGLANAVFLQEGVGGPVLSAVKG